MSEWMNEWMNSTDVLVLDTPVTKRGSKAILIAVITS